MLEFYQETSKLSTDSFMASQDRVVPQKSNFWKKIFEEVLNMCSDPPWLVNCVILKILKADNSKGASCAEYRKIILRLEEEKTA